MSILESAIENEERRYQEIHNQEDIGRHSGYEGKHENFETEQLFGNAEKASDYQDRVERLKQRSEEREQAAEKHAAGKSEISFGSRAAENAADKLEARKKLEQQVKQEEEKLRIHEKELKRAGGSEYWTQKRTQEMKDDIRNIKELEKKISEL